jgi:hypothetical protein
MKRLRSNFTICFNESLENWHQSTDRLNIFFMLITKYGFTDHLHYWGKIRLFRKIKTLDEVIDIMKQSVPDRYIFGDIKKADVSGKLMLSIDFLSDCEFDIMIIFDEKYFACDLLDRNIALILDAYRQIGCLGSPSEISLEGINIPEIRPKRLLSGISSNSGIVNFYEKDYFSGLADKQRENALSYKVYSGDQLENPEDYNYLSGHNGDIDQLRTADLPEIWKRTSAGSLTIIRFLDDLFLPDKDIKDILMKRQKWIYDNLRPKLDGDWNEKGDYREGYFNLIPWPYLTFYNSSLKKGFKSMAINPDGSIDEDLFNMIKSWINNSKLPDNTPIKSMDIILPSRESALKIFEKAKAIGVGKVLYAGQNNELWNPHPEGNWL